MKTFHYLLCGVVICGQATVQGAEKDVPPSEAIPAPPQGAKAQLEDLIDQVKWKMRKGHRTEARLGFELQRFDQLLKEHAGEKTDDVAEILRSKALLYVEVFDEPDKALPILRQMKAEFPETTQGRQADELIAVVEKQAEAVRLRRGLTEGKLFPELDVNDMDGKPIRLEEYRGKVVLINFWASWDAVYRAELTHMLKAYQEYHEKGFEIIGINLDEDEAKVRTFLKDHGVTWRQHFDGQGWKNKVAARFAIRSVPTTYLLDREGKILDQNLRGDRIFGALTRAFAQSPESSP